MDTVIEIIQQEEREKILRTMFVYNPRDDSYSIKDEWRIFGAEALGNL